MDETTRGPADDTNVAADEAATPSPDELDADAVVIRQMRERLRGPVPATPHYAGFFVRLLAFGIDAVILTVFTLPLVLAGLAGIKAGLLAISAPAPVTSDDTVLSVLYFGWCAMAAIYFTALHSGAGQTIGKAIVGIRVRSLDLGAIGVARSLVRALGYTLSSTLLGLGFVTIAVTRRKRGWHDYLAGTCVVRLAPDEA